MAEFIASRIIKEASKSETLAINKYKSYFVTLKKKIYEPYRADVDAILEVEGYGYCIVTE